MVYMLAVCEYTRLAIVANDIKYSYSYREIVIWYHYFLYIEPVSQRCTNFQDKMEHTYLTVTSMIVAIVFFDGIAQAIRLIQLFDSPEKTSTKKHYDLAVCFFSISTLWILIIYIVFWFNTSRLILLGLLLSSVFLCILSQQIKLVCIFYLTRNGVLT